VALYLKRDARPRAIASVGVDNKIIERLAERGLLDSDAHNLTSKQATRSPLDEKRREIGRNDRPFKRKACTTSKFRALDHC